METSNQSKLKNLVAPDAERRRATQEKLKEISCYLLIGVISIITIFVVPLLSGSIQGDFKMCFPTTAEGWIVYWAISGGSALGNISIFVLFKLQAKINCQDNENFKKANELLAKLNGQHGFIPRSPAKMNAEEYAKKGTTIIISSLCSFVVITSLIISFDLVSFISCIIASFIAIAFGWITMIKNEVYWTSEYLLYAEYKIKKEEEKAKKEEEKKEAIDDNH